MDAINGPGKLKQHSGRGPQLYLAQTAAWLVTLLPGRASSCRAPSIGAHTCGSAGLQRHLHQRLRHRAAQQPGEHSRVGRQQFRDLRVAGQRDAGSGAAAQRRGARIGHLLVRTLQSPAWKRPACYEVLTLTQTLRIESDSWSACKHWTTARVMGVASPMTCRVGRQLLGGMNLQVPSASNLPAAQVQVRVPGTLRADGTHAADGRDDAQAVLREDA